MRDERLPRPVPREAFRRALRARLMTEATTVLGRRETTWSRFRDLLSGPALRPALAIAAALVILVAGAGKAAADSLPGDAAFGLKRAAEELQLALSLDDTTKVKVLVAQADHRLAELSQAASTRSAEAPTASAEYAAAVARLRAAIDALKGQPGVSEDQRSEADDVADAARTKHQAVLSQLENEAPADAQPAIERAKEESEKLRPSTTPGVAPERGSEPSRSPQPSRTPEPSRPEGRGTSPAPAPRR